MKKKNKQESNLLTLPKIKYRESAVDLFGDQAYYSDLIEHLGDKKQEFNESTNAYFNTKNNEDKFRLLRRLIGLRSILLEKINLISFEEPTRPEILFTRYGVLHPKLLSNETKVLLNQAPLDNETGAPVYYADEWLKRVASGLESPLFDSSTEKVKSSESLKQEDLENLIKDLEVELKEQKLEEREFFEDKNQLIKKNIENLQDLFSSDEEPFLDTVPLFDISELEVLQKVSIDLNTIYTLNARQKKIQATINNREEDLVTKKNELLNLGVDEGVESDELTEAEQHKNYGESSSEEIRNILDLIKMTEGPKGNSFPFLISTFSPGNVENYGFRIKVLELIIELENIDCTIFSRTVSRETRRVVPNFLILPSYGNRSICWKALDPRNKKDSRGVIGVPLYSSNLRLSLIIAFGELRWETAKELIGVYWMQEGLTGEYIYYLMSQKITTEPKKYFIPDYILWMTKEVLGVQKLHKDVRELMWRYIPFHESIKEVLEDQAPVYGELMRKDRNRAKKNKQKPPKKS